MLLADLEQFGQALLHNEEVGEKRFEFLIGLATAVVGGVLALENADKPPASALAIAELGFSGLLGFGLITYFRLLHRNRVTDEYKCTLEYIRKKLSVPGDYKVPQTPESKWPKWLRGGLAETTSVVNGALLGGLVYRVLDHSSDRRLWSSAAGLALAGVLWTIAYLQRH